MCSARTLCWTFALHVKHAIAFTWHVLGWHDTNWKKVFQYDILPHDSYLAELRFAHHTLPPPAASWAGEGGRPFRS